MKHFIILLVVAIVTITIVLLVYRPDLLEDVWLWIIGLIGPIIALVRNAFKSMFKFIKSLN